MFRPFLLLVLLLLTTDAAAQRLMQRKRPDIIPLEGQAKRIGWFIAPGLSYTLPPFSNEEQERAEHERTLAPATILQRPLAAESVNGDRCMGCC